LKINEGQGSCFNFKYQTYYLLARRAKIAKFKGERKLSSIKGQIVFKVGRVKSCFLSKLMLKDK